MKKFFCAVLAALTVLLCGCGEKSEYLTLFAMDTVMTFTAYGSCAKEAISQTEALVLKCEALFSAADEDSDISRINRSSGSWVAVSDQTAALVARALEFGAATDGAFDITVYPLVEEWDIMSDNPAVPVEETVLSLLADVGYDRVKTDGNRVFVPAGAAIGLGGIAKGFTANAVADLWRQLGVERGVISLGGNVEVIGSKSAGGGWNVAIQDPLNLDGYAGYLECSDLAVVTSGAYRRFFEIDGVVYHHIIDPSTGYPADSGLLSVTVVGCDGTGADALSTAFFVLGEKRAVELCADIGGFGLILVTEDNRVVVTRDLSDGFTLEESSPYTLEVVG